jgi:tetratricopeptide (TPR) repeat protein
VASKKIKKNPSKKNQQVTIPSKDKEDNKEINQTKQARKGNFFSRPILPGPWQTNAIIFVLLVIGATFLYLGDLHLGFFSVDDAGYITNNPWIKKLNAENIVHIFTTPYFANYSPFHLLSYSLDYALGGGNPFVFHLSSNIWAAIVAGFVFLTGLALTGNRIVGIAAAILFAVHPAHVEAIVWISSRKDLVAATFALPSLLAYLKYRKGGKTLWYIISLVLFAFALLGKLSVATFSAVFLAHDLFIEKRSLVKSLIDKIPFVAVTLIIALAVSSAQPISGNRPDPYVYLVALGQSLWLLTGFGSYVVYRVPPQPASMGLEVLSTLLLLAIFLFPLLLRKRWPLVTVLIYWILFGWIPAQVLSFVHPVTDRYLFFPSVAATILIAWAVITTAKKLGNRGLIAAIVLLLVVASLWLRATLNYLSEWRDPRSVWFAATSKSSDVEVAYSMGGHYLDMASRLGSTPRGTRLTESEAKSLASLVWENDPRLPALLSEWSSGKHSGPMENEFQKSLRSLAWDDFEQAAKLKIGRALPLLYFRRGVLLLDEGKLPEAKKELLYAIDETSRFTFSEVSEEILVSSHNALGVIAFKEGDFRGALRWYKLAEEEQTRFGGNWIPDIAEKRKKMEGTVSLQSGDIHPSKIIDPEAAYSLGMHYLDVIERLGTTPKGGTPLSKSEAELIANEVWKGNPNLPVLLSEWEKGQHGTATEKSFQNDLKDLAWKAFEAAIHSKGKQTMPNLYFRRGMILGERNDLKGAQKEFLTAVDEASREPDINIKQETTVLSHDALGIVAWKSGDYRGALQWFKLVEEEQARFGTQWVRDIASKKQQMEAMIVSKTK